MSRLFTSLLGREFARLPESVRRVHGAVGELDLAGDVVIERGQHPAARALARLASLPPAGDGPLRVQIVREGRGEYWIRDFGGHRMASHLWQEGGLLVEQLGPVRMRFALRVEDAKLHWQLVGIRGLIFPLPPALFPGTQACISDDQGRYAFEVRSALRGAGRIINYRGWLDG